MNKACPIVLRYLNQQPEILAFQHPLAGNQIVKGTIESGELLEHACVRELKEESGLSGEPIQRLGRWDAVFENQVWGLVLMNVTEPIPERFRFFTQDDGGHNFEFFWQPLHKPLDQNWHPLFKGAIEQVRTYLPVIKDHYRGGS